MKARGLIPSMIALTAGCTASGAMEADDPGAGFRVDRIEVAGDGAPYFVGGQLGRAASRIDDAAGAPAALAGVLPAIADVLRVPAADLIPTRVARDSVGLTHVRLAQRKHGLRVVGGDVVLHLGADGTVGSVTSTARDRALDPTPTLAAADAARRAVAATEGQTSAEGGELVYVISTGDGELHLAWEVLVVGTDRLLRDQVYVDAHGGAVVERRPQVFTARNRNIYDGEGKTLNQITNLILIGQENSPPAGDPVALAAYTNTGATYDCYRELYQRDSYDAAGADLDSLVHVLFQAPGGTTGNNAAWLGGTVNVMVYGDGDGTLMSPLAYGFDVTTHELTHAVTDATADLTYQNESGALNEAMSDIMAAVCEVWKDKAITADTWLIGEDIYTPNTAGDALRYMNDPTKDRVGTTTEFYSRDYYPERYTGTQDNGGVHLNSGIPNLAFYLLVSGGKHPRAKTTVTVPGIGVEKAGKIFYDALTTRFVASTNLAMARTATEQVAQALYPGCTRLAVSAAWAAVGVGAAPVDAMAPTVAIAAPADGAQVAPGFPVEVTANDDQCIVKVELSVDGALVQTLTEPPFTFTTDPALAPGPHTIQVTTYDAVNQATATATVTIGSSGGACTTDDQCGDGETCQSGTCQPTGDDPGGCCRASDRGGRGALGSLALMLATAFALRRRRARR